MFVKDDINNTTARDISQTYLSLITILTRVWLSPLLTVSRVSFIVTQMTKLIYSVQQCVVSNVRRFCAC